MILDHHRKGVHSVVIHRNAFGIRSHHSRHTFLRVKRLGNNAPANIIVSDDTSQAAVRVRNQCSVSPLRRQEARNINNAVITALDERLLRPQLAHRSRRLSRLCLHHLLRHHTNRRLRFHKGHSSVAAHIFLVWDPIPCPHTSTSTSTSTASRSIYDAKYWPTFWFLDDLRDHVVFDLLRLLDFVGSIHFCNILLHLVGLRKLLRSNVLVALSLQLDQL